MKRSFLVFTFSLAVLLGVYAQALDSAKTKNRYLSIHANQLIRQVLNFGGSTGNVANPFSFNFSTNNKITGNGVNIGFGYLVSSSSDGDAFNERKTSIKDANFRVGYDFKKYVTKQIIVGYGIDVIFQSQVNRTSNKNQFGSNQSTEIKTMNKDIGWGFGPRLTLIYQINHHIAVGTESSYYLKALNTKSEISTFSRFLAFDPVTGQNRIQTNRDEEKSDSKSAQLLFEQPTVIYLIYRF